MIWGINALISVFCTITWAKRIHVSKLSLSNSWAVLIFSMYSNKTESNIICLRPILALPILQGFQSRLVSHGAVSESRIIFPIFSSQRKLSRCSNCRIRSMPFPFPRLTISAYLPKPRCRSTSVFLEKKSNSWSLARLVSLDFSANKMLLFAKKRCMKRKNRLSHSLLPVSSEPSGFSQNRFAHLPSVNEEKFSQ